MICEVNKNVRIHNKKEFLSFSKKVFVNKFEFNQTQKFYELWITGKCFKLCFVSVLKMKITKYYINILRLNWGKSNVNSGYIHLNWSESDFYEDHSIIH